MWQDWWAGAPPQTFEESGAFGAEAAADGSAHVDLAGAGEFGVIAGCAGNAQIISTEIPEPELPPEEPEATLPILGAWAFPGRSRKQVQDVQIRALVSGRSKMTAHLRGRMELQAMITGGSRLNTRMVGRARLGIRVTGLATVESRLEAWPRPDPQEEAELLAVFAMWSQGE
jgi:hypothetical protein